MPSGGWDDGRTELAGIAVAGHGPTTVALDASGHHLGPAIVWLDTRAAALAAELSATIGVPVWQLGSLAHERWMAAHQPARHARATAFLSSWDWLTHRLSGRIVRSVPPESRHPLDPVLRAGGGDPALFGTSVEWGVAVGEVLPGPAQELGIPAGTAVIAGGNDALASFHGAGLSEPGDAVDAGGTAGGLGIYWIARSPSRAPTVRARRCRGVALRGRHERGGQVGRLDPGHPRARRRGGCGHAHRRCLLHPRGGGRPGVPAVPLR